MKKVGVIWAVLVFLIVLCGVGYAQDYTVHGHPAEEIGPTVFNNNNGGIFKWISNTLTDYYKLFIGPVAKEQANTPNTFSVKMANSTHDCEFTVSPSFIWENCNTTNKTIQGGGGTGFLTNTPYLNILNFSFPTSFNRTIILINNFNWEEKIDTDPTDGEPYGTINFKEAEGGGTIHVSPDGVVGGTLAGTTTGLGGTFTGTVSDWTAPDGSSKQHINGIQDGAAVDKTTVSDGAGNTTTVTTTPTGTVTTVTDGTNTKTHNETSTSATTSVSDGSGNTGSVTVTPTSVTSTVTDGTNTKTHTETPTSSSTTITDGAGNTAVTTIDSTSITTVVKDSGGNVIAENEKTVQPTGEGIDQMTVNGPNGNMNSQFTMAATAADPDVGQSSIAVHDSSGIERSSTSWSANPGIYHYVPSGGVQSWPSAGSSPIYSPTDFAQAGWGVKQHQTWVCDPGAVPGAAALGCPAYVGVMPGLGVITFQIDFPGGVMSPVGAPCKGPNATNVTLCGGI